MPTAPARLRIAEPALLFWVVKLLTTGVGEACSDWLNRTFDPLLVVPIAALAFAACFVVQFTAKRYAPWRYWLFVTMVAVFGTMVADAIHVVLGVPYLASTVAFAVVLAAVLLVWRRVEGTLDVHSVTSRRAELFYWATVLATFALGTAFGDLTATTFGLGYLGSGLVFLVLFAIPFGARRLGLAATAAFWWAYIVTRPLGASFADWLGVEPARGGVGIGTLVVTAIGLVAIVVLVAVMQLRMNVRRPAVA